MKKTKKTKLSTKLLIGMICFGLLNMIVISLVVGIYYYSAEKADYTDTATSMARAASRFIDGDRVPGYLDVVGTDANGAPVYYTDDYYDVVMDYLVAEQSEHELVKYVYVLIPDGDSCTYVWDAVSADNFSPRGYTSHPTQKEQELLGLAFSREPQERIMVSRSELWGDVVCAFYPIFGSDGEPVAIVGVDLALEGIAQAFVFYFLLILLAVLLVTAVSALILFVGMKRILVKPVEELNTAAKSMVGELSGETHLDLAIHTGDELEELSDSFQKMNADLHQYIESLSVAAADREHVHTEVAIAKQIQNRILPNEFPAFPERADFDIYASIYSGKLISGDFYDFFLIDPDHLAMVVGDVSDKGVPAALYMVMVETLIKNRAQEHLSPADVLQSVSDQMLEYNMEMFSMVWFAELELSTGKGIAANAGYQHPILCRAGKRFESLEYPHSPPVGAIEGVRFRDHGFYMEPGDTLFIYSDGMRDATNAQGEAYGKARILKALNREPEATPSVLLQTVSSDIQRFLGEEQQEDDLAMLAMEYYGPNGAAAD